MSRDDPHTTPAPGDRPRFWATTLYAMFGILVWTLHFGFVYGVGHVVCSPALAGEPAGVARILILVGTIPFLVAIALAGLWPQKLARLFRVGTMAEDTDKFLRSVTRFISLLSFIGVLWAGATAFVLPMCTG